MLLHSLENGLTSRDREVLVLLSGGIDSAACIDFYRDFGRPPFGLFVDYY